MSMNTDLLDVAGVAALLEVKPATVATYHKDASRRRREDAARPGDLPAPDTVVSRRPWWTVKTIRDWQRSERPGRGVGGGRPKTKQQQARDAEVMRNG